MTGPGFDIHLDEVTLAGAKRGDMRACEKIYRSYHTPAYTLAVRICRCRELAKEVTQEAFITAFRRIPQFRGESPFWGWLKRVVINHAISSLRKLSPVMMAGSGLSLRYAYRQPRNAIGGALVVGWPWLPAWS